MTLIMQESLPISRLSELREKYPYSLDNELPLDSEPWKDNSMRYRYTFSAGINHVETLPVGGRSLITWLPREGFAQQQESYQ